MFENRLSGGARVRSLLSRCGFAVVIVLTLSVVASAYTLVFRNGNRMEIPDEFTLTRTTLTFEIAPGFQKTIMVSLIDIAATERANNEPWGSFFKHREQNSADSQPAQPAQTSAPAVKTVTNADLLAFRQRRIESERTYEQRRVQLGLPTVAETRRRQAEEEAGLREELRGKAFANKQEETYWRSRARELRTEIAMVDNQIHFVRGRLNELNESSARQQSWTSTYPIWPYYDPSTRNGRWGRRGNRPPPIIFGPPQSPYGYPNQSPYGYPNQYPNGYPNQNPYGYPSQYPNQYPYGYPNQNPYGYPNQYPYGYPNQNPYGYPNAPPNSGQESEQREHDDLTYRLNDLLVKRAGLATQWQALEDEARDARVPQVWLEP
jgi:hypothetical protein